MYEAAIWDFASMYMGKGWRDKVREKTVQEIEAELEALKKGIDRQIEAELLDRLAYSLQHSIVFLEEDIEEYPDMIKKLKAQQGAGSEVFRVNIAICEQRLEAAQRNLDKRKKRLGEVMQQLKDYAFSVKSKDLVEDLEEAKKRALEPKTEDEEPPQLQE